MTSPDTESPSRRARPTVDPARASDSGEPPERAWHALPADEVVEALRTSRAGLGQDEAAHRLEVHGPNALEEIPPPPWWRTLLDQFASPLIYILVLAAVLTIVLGEYIDAGVIGAVLALNASIGFVQERRAEASVRSLMQLVSPTAHVVRDGHEWSIPSAELVPGDVVLFESGVRVPADVRLVSTASLQIDESLLTGESSPVDKSSAPAAPVTPLADRHGMAFSGATVTSGRGRGVVVSTGAATELGRIAEQVRETESLDSPLQARMRRFARIIGAIVAVSALSTFGLGLALGEAPGEMLLVAAALAVAAIPEGLPVVLTVALALGVRRMARRNAIIRRLPAVETLGSTTLIGSDKTGTLTENRMTVSDLWVAGTLDSVDELPADPRDVASVDPPGLDADPRALALLAGLLANEAELVFTEDGIETHGEPTEVALLVAAARHGLDPGECRNGWSTVAEIPFESERRYSASVRAVGELHAIFVKGAPERVLEMCSSVAGDDERAAGFGGVREAAHAMAEQGLRVLAVAYRELPHDHGHRGDEPDEPEGLVFLGLFGLLDPPRAGVREAIEGCQRAGQRVVMITGDHAATARAIAHDLGIVDRRDAPVLTGTDLDGLDDDELRARLEEVSVFARVAPDHKLRVVESARAAGHVVAVTGDGVNDAPALKRADIGIAMGKSGTDVARESADMVLADDNFVSIHDAVEEGRVTFDNVRKVTFFLVSTGAGTFVIIPIAMVLGWPLILLPAQLLWLNLVTKGLQDLALAFEPAEPDVLDRPPRPRDEPVITRLLWSRTVITGVVMAAGTLALFHWARVGEDLGLAQAQTVALTTLVVFQAFHLGSSRSETRSVFQVPLLSNRFLAFAQLGALAVHTAALYLPPTQFVLRVEPIGFDAWVRILVVAVSVLVAVEFDKLVRRRAAARRTRAVGPVRLDPTPD